MFVLSNFFSAVAFLLDQILNIYMWIVVISALLSWVNPDPYNPIVRFLRKATEPVFYQIRKRLPVNFGGLDISPVVVILAILFLRQFVVATLYGFARTLS